MTEDLERYRMNTVISGLMELTNALQRTRDAGTVDRTAWNEAVELLTLMMAPECPHLAEEVWERTGHGYSVHQQAWPTPDPALLRRDTVEIPVQVDGKLRERLVVGAEASESEVRALAEALPRVAELMAGRQVARVVYVPGRLLNIVLR